MLWMKHLLMQVPLFLCHTLGKWQRLMRNLSNFPPIYIRPMYTQFGYDSLALNGELLVKRYTFYH